MYREGLFCDVRLVCPQPPLEEGDGQATAAMVVKCHAMVLSCAIPELKTCLLSHKSAFLTDEVTGSLAGGEVTTLILESSSGPLIKETVDQIYDSMVKADEMLDEYEEEDEDATVVRIGTSDSCNELRANWVNNFGLKIGQEIKPEFPQEDSQPGPVVKAKKRPFSPLSSSNDALQISKVMKVETEMSIGDIGDGNEEGKAVTPTVEDILVKAEAILEDVSVTVTEDKEVVLEEVKQDDQEGRIEGENTVNDGKKEVDKEDVDDEDDDDDDDDEDDEDEEDVEDDLMKGTSDQGGVAGATISEKTCSSCRTTLPFSTPKDRADFEKHVVSHLKCVCNIAFESRKAYTDHMKSAHEEKKLYKCTQGKCGRTFATKKARNRHEKSKHDMSVFEGAAAHVCHVCGRAFVSNHYMSVHYRFEHADQKCDQCGLVFVGRLKYDKHLREAHKSLTICEQCGQHFTNKKYLRSHIVNVHTADKDRPHVCKLCPKGFLTQTRLNDHVARSHEGIRPYTCRSPGCTRAFTLGTVRKRHEKRDHDLDINMKRGSKSKYEVHNLNFDGTVATTTVESAAAAAAAAAATAAAVVQAAAAIDTVPNTPQQQQQDIHPHTIIHTAAASNPSAEDHQQLSQQQQQLHPQHAAVATAAEHTIILTQPIQQVAAAHPHAQQLAAAAVVHQQQQHQQQQQQQQEQQQQPHHIQQLHHHLQPHLMGHPAAHGVFSNMVLNSLHHPELRYNN